MDPQVPLVVSEVNAGDLARLLVMTTDDVVFLAGDPVMGVRFLADG